MGATVKTEALDGSSVEWFAVLASPGWSRRRSCQAPRRYGAGSLTQSGNDRRSGKVISRCSRLIGAPLSVRVLKNVSRVSSGRREVPSAPEDHAREDCGDMVASVCVFR